MFTISESADIFNTFSNSCFKNFSIRERGINFDNKIDTGQNRVVYSFLWLGVDYGHTKFCHQDWSSNVPLGN